MEPRKRKRLLLAFAGIVALVAGLWFFLNRNTEPSYNGRRLGEWVEIMAPKYPLPRTDAERADASRAIQAIGTNALPYLVQWIAYENSNLRKRLVNSLLKAPVRFRTNPEFVLFVNRPALRCMGAAQAFSELGPMAAAAISPLTAIFQSTNVPDWNRRQVFTILARLGPDALPVTRESISSFDQNLWLVYALDAVPPEVIREFSTEILAQAAGTNTPVVVGLSQWLRNTLVISPEDAMPVFAKGLEDPRPQVRLEASVGLWVRADYAKPVLPTLLQALDDPDPEVRRNISNVVRRIAPDRLPRRQPP